MPTTIAPRACKQCGQEYQPSYGPQKYCGHACMAAALRKPRPGCQTCGKTLRKITGKFCSRACQQPAEGKGRAHPKYAEALRLFDVHGFAKTARLVDVPESTLRNWVYERRGEKTEGADGAWCKECGEDLPAGEEFCDDDCRREYVLATEVNDVIR